MFIAFLDEFGHIGPFVSRNDPRYNSSPVFGLAGYILPHQNVRSFATWFFQLKCHLLQRDVASSGVHPATWEKKGTELFATRNVRKYSHIPAAVGRMINKIYKLDGKLFYHGREKYQAPQDCNPSGLYRTILTRSIRKIDRFADVRQQEFMMILDQHSDRIRLLEAAAKTMFGNDPARNLIEPPFQVESHLYQTAQAADSLAAVIGRLLAYRVAPAQYADWQWAEDRFGRRVNENATHSSLWRPASPQGALPLNAPGGGVP